jgi:hypothetical protein
MNKNKNIRLILIYAILLLVAGFFLPKEVDWRSSFSRMHSRPFGCEVLYTELPNLFEDRKIETNERSFYEIQDTLESLGDIILIIDEQIQMDSLDMDVLIKYIDNGGTLMMSAYYFPDVLMDTLHVDVSYGLLVNDILREGFRATSVDHNFYNEELMSMDSFQLEVDGSYRYLESGDSLDLDGGLGWVNEVEKVNFAHFNMGAGQVFLHTNPFVFTNYNVLDDQGSNYVAGVLSHLPKGDIIWDENYKVINSGNEGKTLQVLLAQPPLRYALYIALAGIVLYLVFMSKRKQRVIPELDQYRNDSKDLVETIGSLYYNTSRNKTIANKKIKLFKQELYKRYKMNGTEITKENLEFYSDKMGKSREEIRSVLESIRVAEMNNEISDPALRSLNESINTLLYNQ